MSTQARTTIAGTAFPYPGLRPFEPGESHLFFGRDEHVFEMFSLLEDHRFLAVVGASGSGKSSLVQAGMLPRLRDEGLINQRDGAWRFLTMRPGNSPLDALAAACQQPDSVTGATLARGELHGGDPVMTRVVLESGPKGLVRILADAGVSDDDNILLLVDQFEELFRFAGSEASSASGATLSRNESLQFVALLLETARQSERPVHVVLTMRTDFIGDCDQFDGLPQAINAGQFLVPRLSWRQQELAITAPLQLPGFESQIDRAIVDHMLNAASHERDALPLVQHALLRMWLLVAGPDVSPSDSESAPTTRHITETQHYLPIGGLSHALDRHASDLYESLTTEQQRIAACLFRCLGERIPKGQLTRRVTSVEEVAGVANVKPQEVIDLIEVFRQPGVHFLVTSPAGAVTGATNIDISHESLLRQWKLLQEWIEEESEAAAGYRRLIDAVNLGEELIDDIRLELAIQWRNSVRPTPAWARRYDPAVGRLSQCLQLIDDSVAEARKDTIIKRIGALTILALIVFISIILTTNAIEERESAEQAAASAIEQRQIAETRTRVVQDQVNSLLEMRSDLNNELASKDANIRDLEERLRAERILYDTLSDANNELQTQLGDNLNNDQRIDLLREQNRQNVERLSGQITNLESQLEQSKKEISNLQVDPRLYSPFAEMVTIPAGTIQMGSKDGELDELPVHEVNIDRPFALSRHEVTFQQYDIYALAKGQALPDDEGWGRGNLPVINVSWNDVQGYIAWLNEVTSGGYRLPSEAEWEYGARAGTDTWYSWGDDIGNNLANCNGCGSDWDSIQTAPVGSFNQNNFGLFDMHGNVAEWVQDCYVLGYEDAPEGGSALEVSDCSQRVLRGGSWDSAPEGLRSANRNKFTPAYSLFFSGFRLAQDL